MSQAIYTRGAPPPTPPAGKCTIYFKTDGRAYWLDEFGTETPFKAVGSGSGDLLADGTIPLTADWDVGAFKITANQIESDVAPGTAPLIVASNTLVANLNSDQLDGQEGSYYASVAYVDAAVVGLLDHKGGYDASTNTPDLDTSPSGIKSGDAYVVTVAGTFYATALEIGDWLYANIDDPASAADWTIVQGNLSAASIKTLYESNADTNEFSDAEQTIVANAIVDGDISEAEGMMRKTGAGAYEGIKTNLSATTDPGASDDNTAGYAKSSVWVNTVTEVVWFCANAATGAAVWTAGGGGRTWLYKTAAYTMASGEVVVGDTSVTAAFTVTLPASPSNGDLCSVYDNGNAGAAILSVDPNGETIDGVTGNLELDVGYTQADMLYDGTVWQLTLSVPSTGVTEADVTALGTGKKSFWIPVRQMFEGGTGPPGPEITVGSATTQGQFKARPYDDTAIERMYFDWTVPRDMDVTQVISFIPIWSPATTNTGDAYWEMRLLPYADGDPIDVVHLNNGASRSLDTANGTIDDIHIGPESAGYVFPGMAKGAPVSLIAMRQSPHASDTLTGDANLIGFRVIYRTDAETED